MNCFKSLILLFNILIVFVISNNVFASKTITILAENDCPYSCTSQNETGNGFIQDILRAIFEKYDLNVKFQITPWLRSLHNFNNKASSVDGMIGMKVHPVKKELALFPEEEIARYTHRLYALKNSSIIKTWKYQGVTSLKDFKIGSMKGWSYCDKDITQYLNEGSEPYVQALSSEAGTELNFKKLLAGRIDIWIANLTNTEYFLLKEKEAGNTSVDKITGFFDIPITNEVNVYPIFYNNDEGRKYIEIFTIGIRELRKSGELEKIMKKYGLTDWK